MTDAQIPKPKKLIKVLSVEDNTLNRLLLEDYLSDNGYHVVSLAEGGSFFSTLVHFQPDVVLLDLKLPDVSGYQLLEELQQQPELQSLPVIVVSAFSFQADQQRALKLGAQHYFVKPVDPRLLTRIIEEVALQ